MNPKKPEHLKGQFFDITKLPEGFGIIVFPISIARAEPGAGQDPKKCLEYIKHFSPAKITEPKVGLNMIYGDFLYLHSKEQAAILKNRFANVTIKHKNAFQNLLEKEAKDRFQIQHAFSFESWNQLYLDYKGDFNYEFNRLKNMYLKDPLFQKYVQQDADYFKRDLTDEQINFFLEEHLMLYLISKKQIVLPNEYVQGRERWVLWCYPGVPLKAQAYVYQRNPLHLKIPENVYQNCCYDLESNKLIDYTEIDLETYNYQYNN
jgi:hypothetical protein